MGVAFTHEVFYKNAQSRLRSLDGHVLLEKLSAARVWSIGRTIHPQRREPGEMNCFWETYMAGSERVHQVRRESEYGEILADEASKVDSPRCFTPEDAAQSGSRFHEVFTQPTSGPPPQSVGGRATFDMPNCIEKTR